MTFIPYQGDWTARQYASKTTTAYAEGTVVYTDGTNVIPAVATTEDILGICISTKAVGDTSTDPITVLVPRDVYTSTAKADVGTGTLTKANEGILCDLDNTNPATTLDISTTDEKCCRIEKFLSSSLAVVSFVPQKR